MRVWLADLRRCGHGCQQFWLSHLQRASRGESTLLDAETRERLRSLGYVYQLPPQVCEPSNQRLVFRRLTILPRIAGHTVDVGAMTSKCPAPGAINSST